MTQGLATLLTEEPSVRTSELNGQTVFEVFKDEAMEGDPLMVVCSAKGFLLNGSHADMVASVLAGSDSSSAMVQAARVQAAGEHLRKMAPAEICMFAITQLDNQVEAYYHHAVGGRRSKPAL